MSRPRNWTPEPQRTTCPAPPVRLADVPIADVLRQIARTHPPDTTFLADDRSPTSPSTTDTDRQNESTATAVNIDGPNVTGVSGRCWLPGSTGS